MSQRRQDLAADAQQHVVMPPPRKGEIARRGWRYRIPLQATEGPAPPKDIFADQLSPPARTMRAEIERVARRPFNILITGETGTGKTYAAREIHRLSARANNPFIELNSANLPEHLVEAELFGLCAFSYSFDDNHCAAYVYVCEQADELKCTLRVSNCDGAHYADLHPLPKSLTDNEIAHSIIETLITATEGLKARGSIEQFVAPPQGPLGSQLHWYNTGGL